MQVGEVPETGEQKPTYERVSYDHFQQDTQT